MKLSEADKGLQEIGYLKKYERKKKIKYQSKLKKIEIEKDLFLCCKGIDRETKLATDLSKEELDLVSKKCREKGWV